MILPKYFDPKTGHFKVRAVYNEKEKFLFNEGVDRNIKAFRDLYEELKGSVEFSQALIDAGIKQRLSQQEPQAAVPSPTPVPPAPKRRTRTRKVVAASVVSPSQENVTTSVRSSVKAAKPIKPVLTSDSPTNFFKLLDKYLAFKQYCWDHRKGYEVIASMMHRFEIYEQIKHSKDFVLDLRIIDYDLLMEHRTFFYDSDPVQQGSY